MTEPTAERLLVAVALGSNLPPDARSPFDLDPPKDPRARALEGALVLLRARGHDVLAASPLYETEPEGEACEGQPRFLNACILVETDSTPLALLEDCESIEREAGRRSKGDNSARPLDLDLIAAWRSEGGAAEPLAPIETERLVLPHPRMPERSFVLVPLVGVAPDAPIALTGKPSRTAWEMLRQRAKEAAWLRPGPASASFPSRPGESDRCDERGD